MATCIDGDLMNETELEQAGVVIEHPVYRRIYTETLDAMRRGQDKEQ